MIYERIAGATFVTFHRLSDKGKNLALEKGYLPAVGIPCEVENSEFPGFYWWELQGLGACPVQAVCRKSQKEFWQVDPNSEVRIFRY